MTPVADAHTQTRDALVERLFGAALNFEDICAVYLGDRLGLYGALADLGSASAAEVAARTATDERYVREWLEQQAVTGILAVEDPLIAPGERRYSIPDGHLEVLLERDSLNWMVPLVRQMIGMVTPLQQLLEAYRSGAGVPYADYGSDMREGIGLMNRAMFVNLLGTTSRTRRSPSRPCVLSRVAPSLFVSGPAPTARQSAPTPPDRAAESQNANRERSMTGKQLDLEHRSQPSAAEDSRSRLVAAMPDTERRLQLAGDPRSSSPKRSCAPCVQRSALTEGQRR